MTYNKVIEYLYDLKDDEKVILKEKKFGITSTNSLGIYHKELKMIAKEIGQDNELAYSFLTAEFMKVEFYVAKCLSPKMLRSH